MNISDKYYFIDSNFTKHIKKVVINQYPKLNYDDRDLITRLLLNIIDHIAIKFCFKELDFDKYKNQFMQNDNRDILGILNILLPYISDTNNPRSDITSFNDIYLSKINPNIDLNKDEPRYTYSNIQYNRCNRDKKIITEISYDKSHLIDNYNLLRETIHTVSRKLYVNWINIRPIECLDLIFDGKKENEFERIKLEMTRISDSYNEFKHIHNWEILSPEKKFNPDKSFDLYADDIYDSLFDIINYSSNVIWFIKTPKGDIRINLLYLKDYLGLDSIIKGLTWRQLNTDLIEYFNSKWHYFVNQIIDVKSEVLIELLKSFNKYASINPDIENWTKIERSKDQKNQDFIDEIHAQILQVKTEYIYNFLYEQYNEFKTTYFGKIYITKDNSIRDVEYYHLINFFDIIKEDIPIDKRWRSLKSDDKKKIIERLNKHYDKIPQIEEFRILIKYIVFDYMSYNGLLSTFVPTPELTDEKLFPSSYQEKNRYIQNNINKLVFNSYKKNYYYYLTNSLYTDLFLISDKGEKTNYIDAMKKNNISSMSLWYTMFVMDWISQIHFYHKYMNNRVMYVTGGTGVGKSSQVPKLLLYALKMVDHRLHGKISCSVPRRTLVLSSSTTLSNQLGVPIFNYITKLEDEIQTSNFYVTYQHSQDRHATNNKLFIPNIKLCTDGVLLQDIVTNSLLKEGHIDDKNNFVFSPTFRNKYDIVIIDEAHEHNINMDMILTIMRNYLFYNNQIKLVIISATMDEDEPYYRRFYRDINDNRMYPHDQFLIENNLDRINVDRRIDLSPPGGTIYKIDECYLNECPESNINPDQLVLNIANKSSSGNILYFQPGRGEISKSVKYLNTVLPANIIAIPYYSEMRDDKKRIVEKIDRYISRYNLPKSISYDMDLEKLDKNKIRYVPTGTYNRAVIVSTNIAEASITFPGLSYVVDTGTKKITDYDYKTRDDTLELRDISESSRKQRRGRVGRIAPGHVFYTYQRGQMERNKESYKISTSNISEVLYSALKNNDDEHKLFEDINPNDPDLKIKKEKIKGDIINFIRIHYNYDHTPDSFIKYLGNPEHYDYQNSTKPPPMYQTGFTHKELNDDTGNFYIIHPEELNIIRNMKGDITGVKEDDLDKDSIKIIHDKEGTKSIVSKKMESFWKILIENDLIYYDKDILKKTDYGSRLLDLRRLLIETPFQDIVNIIYSYAYGCMDEVIMILALCSEINNNIELLYAKPPKKFKNDLFVIKDISQIIYNYFKKNINLVTDHKKISVKQYSKEYNTKKQYLEFKKTGDISNLTDFNKNLFKKMVKLDIEQKLKLSDDIHVDDVRELFLSDTYIKQIDEYILKPEYKLWCKENNFNPSIIYQIIKKYANLLTNVNKYDKNMIDKDIINLSRIKNHKDNLLSYFKDYLKDKIDVTSDLNENIRRSFIHSYYNNLLKKVTKNYYILASNPMTKYIYEINYLDSLTYGDYIICKYKDNSKNKAYITFKVSLDLIKKLKLTPTLTISTSTTKNIHHFKDNINYLYTQKLPINIDADIPVAYKYAVQDLKRDLNKNIL